MATVRISSARHIHDPMQWVGAPAIDRTNRIERSPDLALPEAAYQRIEAGVAQGYLEGEFGLADGTRFHWVLDR
jgi:hypothetical protein